MATAALKQSTLLALENLGNARTSFDSAKMREAGLRRAFEATDRAAQLARKQYREGLADFTTLKDAERTLLSVGNELAMAQADRAIALVTLYVASGGGWDPDTVAPDKAESLANE
jgi:outer membrane protein TolC